MKKMIAPLLMGAATLWADDPSGAKALFLDPTSGGALVSSRTAPAARKAGGGAKAPVVNAALPKRQPGEVTGLRYWIELEGPGGELKRVLADRPYKSGERVRLHVESNVDGALTVLQSQNGAPYGKLFPRPGASAMIEKFKDNVIPSPKGFFKFDQEPGEIRLLIMVQASTVAAPAGAPPLQVAAARPPAPPADDREAEERALRQLEKLRGSKALVLDDDPSPQTAAATRVVDWKEVQGAEPGMLVVEVKLSHR